MKKKASVLHIAEPCHADWNEMSPVQQGRFCSSCAKPVLDFTTMRDSDILKAMDAAEGSVCGRLTTSQVNRAMFAASPAAYPSFSLQALVLGVALSTFSALNAHAQTEVGKIAVRPIEMPGEMLVMQGEIAATPSLQDSIFSGYVTRLTAGDSVAGAQVTVFDAEGNQLAQSLTNNSGWFEIPLSFSAEASYAVIRAEELGERMVYFSEYLVTSNLTIALYDEEMIIMGLMIRTED